MNKLFGLLEIVPLTVILKWKISITSGTLEKTSVPKTYYYSGIVSTR